MLKKRLYQALHQNRIFMGGAASVKSMVNNEKCDVIVDLRAEATECAYPAANVCWIKVPLKNNSRDPGQKQIIQQAISEVVKAYQKGHKVGFHCAVGRRRTGAVAIGVLLELGLSHTVEEAERKAKCIRKKIQLTPAQRKALQQLFPSKKKSIKKE